MVGLGIVQVFEGRRVFENLTVDENLSGGEQQMLVIGRALMSDPRVVLLDEPSLGLGPMIVEEIFLIIKQLRQEAGVTIFLVEQNAKLALDIADHCYAMENGAIVVGWFSKGAS